MRQGRADRDALLLAARQLRRAGVALAEQADALEQPVGGACLLRLGRAAQSEPERDELAGRELRRERARVVLIGIPERARAVGGERPPAQRAQILPEDAHRSRGRTIEPGEDAQQSALAGPAGAEDDQQLAFGDVERQPLQRRGRTLRRRIDAKQIDCLDRCAHSIPSEKRTRATRSYASRVTADAPTIELAATATRATTTNRQS